MELAQLKFHTRSELAKTKALLAKNCNFDPSALVIHEDLSTHSIPFQGEWMTSGRKKEVLFRLLAVFCRRTNSPGLVIVTDGWGIEHSPEQLKRFRTDPEYFKAFDDLSRDEGIRATAAAGFGRLVETIVVQGQTREFAFGLMQDYERGAKDGVIPATSVKSGVHLPDHKIRFRGDPHVLSSERGDPTGRMFTLFGADEDGDEDFIAKIFEQVAR